MKRRRKPDDSVLWTPRERMAAALCAGCNPKTVDRCLDGKLPVREDTADLLRYAFVDVVNGKSAVDRILGIADRFRRERLAHRREDSRASAKGGT